MMAATSRVRPARASGPRKAEPPVARQLLFVIIVVIPVALIAVPLSLAAWRRRRDSSD